MELEKRKRNRATNFSTEDAHKLVDLVQKYKNILENKKTDAVTWKQKISAWKKIEMEFKASSTCVRGWEQLRDKFKGLKRECRKYVAARRKSVMGTGGGPGENEPSNPLYEKVLALIKLSAEGMLPEYCSDEVNMNIYGLRDDDCLSNTENVENPHEKPDQYYMMDVTSASLSQDLIATEMSDALILQTPLNSALSAAVGSTPEITEVPPSLPHNDSSVVDIDWSVYNPCMLQKPKHPALKVKKHTMESTPSTTDTVQPDEWKKRRLPSYKPTIPTLSAQAKNLKPWADARKDLALLQQECVKKENEDKHEAHLENLQLCHQQMQIYKLQEENLILDNMLKKAQLQKFLVDNNML